MKEVWIGLIGVKATQEGLLPQGARGAYTNGLAFVSDADEYRAKVRQELSAAGYEVTEIEDAEPLRIRRENFEVERDILDLAADCEGTEDVCLSSLHIW